MISFPIEMAIDDVVVPSPKVNGITRKTEKIWSKNTGRTASGKMQGTIVGIKTTYSITWPPLTQADQELIESLVSDKTKAFHTLRLRRPDGSIWETECYFGTPSFTEWSMLAGKWYCTDAKVDAIER